MYLVQEIFTREATKWWFRAILIMAAAQAVVGSLLIAIDCSPSSMLDGADNKMCPGNVRDSSLGCAQPVQSGLVPTNTHMIELHGNDFANSLPGASMDCFFCSGSSAGSIPDHSCRRHRDEPTNQPSEEDLGDNCLRLPASVCSCPIDTGRGVLTLLGSGFPFGYICPSTSASWNTVDRTLISCPL